MGVEELKKYLKYSAAVVKLSNYKTQIDEAANTSPPALASLICSTNKGEYYDVYDAHVSQWLTEAANVHSQILSIQSQLDYSISTAESLRDYWRSLI